MFLSFSLFLSQPFVILLFILDCGENKYCRYSDVQQSLNYKHFFFSSMFVHTCTFFSFSFFFVGVFVILFLFFRVTCRRWLTVCRNMCGILRTIETRCECRRKKYKWNYNEKRIQTDNALMQNLKKYSSLTSTTNEIWRRRWWWLIIVVIVSHLKNKIETKKEKKRTRKEMHNTNSFTHHSFFFFPSSLSDYLVLSLWLSSVSQNRQKRKLKKKKLVRTKQNERFVLSLSLSHSHTW